MWNLFVFAVIGLLTGAPLGCCSRAALLAHSVTILTGMIGAIAGGMISWSWWPDVVGEFHTGNLILSLARP